MWFKRNWLYLVLVVMALMAARVVVHAALNHQTDTTLRRDLCTPELTNSWECERVKWRW